MATGSTQKARELDEKFAISDLVNESARVAGEAAKRGAETMTMELIVCAPKQKNSLTKMKWVKPLDVRPREP